MKKCKQCNQEFTSVSTTGHEQQYCTIKCRNKASNNRRIEKIKNEVRFDIPEDTFTLKEKDEIIIPSNKYENKYLKNRTVLFEITENDIKYQFYKTGIPIKEYDEIGLSQWVDTYTKEEIIRELVNYIVKTSKLEKCLNLNYPTN